MTDTTPAGMPELPESLPAVIALMHSRDDVNKPPTFRSTNPTFPDPNDDPLVLLYDAVEYAQAYARQCYEAGRAAARDAVLEEAANVCDDIANVSRSSAEECADAIRALKGKP